MGILDNIKEAAADQARSLADTLGQEMDLGLEAAAGAAGTAASLALDQAQRAAKDIVETLTIGHF